MELGEDEGGWACTEGGVIIVELMLTTSSSTPKAVFEGVRTRERGSLMKTSR